ncbi:MAG: MarR family transcriptional regulator, partial [Eubacteriales bacterium]|nr:MarR family transcriptional regulator [Eubacteriales bacterium]
RKLAQNQLPTQRELALEMQLSPPTVNASVKSLERQGLIRKLPDERDLRKTRIEITQAGLETAAACRNAFALLDEAAFRGFSPEEALILNSFIRRMADNLLAEAGGKETDAL